MITYAYLHTAMVTALDDAVGKIVTSLKKNKMYKNTFIVFTADVSTIFFQLMYLNTYIFYKFLPNILANHGSFV